MVGPWYKKFGYLLDRDLPPEESVAAFEEFVRIAEELGPDHPMQGASLSTLAAALTRVAGERDAEEAEELLRRAASLQRRAWAADRRRIPRRHGGAECARTDLHTDLATRLNALAQTYDRLGRPGKARCFSAHALRILRETLPSGDHRIAVSLNTLGAMHLKAGAPAQAAPLLREAMAIREEVFPDRTGKPPHHLRTHTARWLAACLFALDPPETAEAEALCARYRLDPAELRAQSTALMGGG